MTANGEFRELRLDDGSAVKLGGGSAIAVNFSNQTREVELLRGAAFFLVHTDAERPFVVRSAKILTRAVGTAFEVRRTASGSSIAVAEGIVEVAQDKPSPSQEKAKQISLRLTAGRQLAISVDEGAATLDAQNVDINEIASWQKGQLAFNNWLVADVVDALRRNYRGLIVIQPGLLTKGRISGVHDLRKPIASLRLLAATQGLRVRQISPWFTTVSRF
ncbi:MAG: FecR domain-containing protein [Pseudomonadota bacterium]